MKIWVHTFSIDKSFLWYRIIPLFLIWEGDTYKWRFFPYKCKFPLLGNFLVFRASPMCAVSQNNQLKITLMPERHILEWHFLVYTQQVQSQSPHVMQRLHNSAWDAGEWDNWFQMQMRPSTKKQACWGLFGCWRSSKWLKAGAFPIEVIYFAFPEMGCIQPMEWSGRKLRAGRR